MALLVLQKSATVQEVLPSLSQRSLFCETHSLVNFPRASFLPSTFRLPSDGPESLKTLCNQYPLPSQIGDAIRSEGEDQLFSFFVIIARKMHLPDGLSLVFY